MDEVEEVEEVETTDVVEEAPAQPFAARLVVDAPERLVVEVVVDRGTVDDVDEVGVDEVDEDEVEDEDADEVEEVDAPGAVVVVAVEPVNEMSTKTCCFVKSFWSSPTYSTHEWVASHGIGEVGCDESGRTYT